MAGVVTQLIGVLVTLSPKTAWGVSMVLGVLAALFGVAESSVAFLWMRHCWRTLEMEDAELSQALTGEVDES